MISVSKLCSFYFPFDKEKILDSLVAKGRGTKEEILAEWDRKRDHGIAVHDKMHKYLIARKHGMKISDTEGIEGYIAFVDWIENHGYKYYSSEVECECTELGIKGRIDALFQKDDHFLIVDWKSSTNDFPSDFCQYPLSSFRRNKNDTYFYQLKVQEYLIHKKFGKSSALAYVVPEGDQFRIFHTELDRDLVESSVQTYKNELAES